MTNSAAQLTRGPYKDIHEIGPHSRQHNLAKLDGRTKEAAIMRRVRTELTQHVGGHPNAVQRALIERCAWLSLRLAMLDKKIASGKEFTEIDSNTYLAWNNSLARTLDKLGARVDNQPKQPSLTAYLAELATQDNNAD
jgi:hypothetical protein